VKPIYIVGTQRDVGKTTLSLGLANAFHKRGLSVGYIKPLGQRIKTSEGHVIHDDAQLVYSCLGQSDVTQEDMAIPLPSGRVEEEVKNLRSNKLLEKVMDSYSSLAREHDVVIAEAMGHVAMGSCLGLSAADVARSMGARALLVSGGGIGRTIDEIFLCSTFINARGADFMGVVINQVWREKYDRVKVAVTRGLTNLGITSYGTVPYEKDLASPTMQQVHGVIGGEIIAGKRNMGNRVNNAIVAAMEAEHMVRHLKESTLVIGPGDRSDNILACLSAQMLGDIAESTLAGLILTGGFRPKGTAMRMIEDAQVPVIVSREDTYTVTSKYRNTVFKIRPGDQKRINAALTIVSEYVDVDGIIKALGE